MLALQNKLELKQYRKIIVKWDARQGSEVFLERWLLIFINFGLSQASKLKYKDK